MADVSLPDGSSISFPDGMSDADISSAVQSHLGTQQMSGFGRLPAMAASYGARGALSAAGMLGSAQGALQNLVNPAADAVSRFFGVEPKETPASLAEGASKDTGLPLPQSPVLGSQGLVGYGRRIGMVDRPDLQPQNTGEKYLSATSEGAGGMLPFLPLMAGGGIASGVRALTQGAAAGAGGEAGAQTFPNHPLAGQIGGSLLGLYGGGKAFDLGNRALGAATGATTPVTQAYKNLGIDQTLAGDVTGDPTMRMIQAYAGKAPGGAGRIHAASEKALDQWGSALENTAAGYGTSATAQEAGTALQNETRNWLQRWNDAQKTAWDQVSAKIAPDTMVDIKPVDAALRYTIKQMPGASNVAGTMQDPIFQRLSTALAYDVGPQKGRTGLEAIPWSDMAAWRSMVGERLQQSLLAHDGSDSAWRKLYGSLSDALGDAATANGAGAEWKAANAVTSEGHQFVENIAGKFINARNPASNTITPEAATTAALSGSRLGGTALKTLRQEMPAAADELAAYKLRSMGSAVPGQQNAAGSSVSPGSFVTQLAPRNLAPEARDALFGANQNVQDLATVGDAMKGTMRFLNTSNTGAHSAAGHAIGGVVGAPIAAYEGYKEGGVPGAVAAAMGAFALPFVPSYAAARLTTSPALTGLLAAPAGLSSPSGLLRVGATYPAARGLLDSYGGNGQ